MWSRPSASYAVNALADELDFVHPARLMMLELVTKAVEHASTDMLVTVAHRGDGLHHVADDSTVSLPRRPPVAPDPVCARSDERGQGAQVVEALARGWGARPTNDGTGKIVWATVLSRHTSRRG
jgi:hypothetical protein